METTVQILCLANSRKNNGRCLAGVQVEYDPVDGNIRLVKSLRDGKPAPRWIRLTSKSYPENDALDTLLFGDVELLDIIEVNVIKFWSEGLQTENAWILQRDGYSKICNIKDHTQTDDILSACVEPTKTLWCPTSATLCPRTLSEAESKEYDYSLQLIRTRSVDFAFSSNQPNKINCNFTTNAGLSCRSIRLTDPRFEKKVGQCIESKAPLAENIIRAEGNIYLTISLGLPWAPAGNKDVPTLSYKYVAAVIARKTGKDD